MICASALSTKSDSLRAFESVLDEVQAGMKGEAADLAVAFVSMHHADSLEPLGEGIARRGLGRQVLACTGEAIVGDSLEIEGAPAVSLWAIQLPGVDLRPIRLAFDEGEVVGWPADLPAEPEGERALILLGDPFSFPADHWLKHLREKAPGLKAVGGMASGGDSPRTHRLMLDGRVYEDGAVAVLIDGPVAVRSVVSQGCRPIGRPMIVTKADGNLIRELGRRPVLEAVREMFAGLSEDDRDLVRAGLHVGRVINEYQEKFGRGDFLVRNVIGSDEEGGLAVTDFVRVGQTIQFQVRDADTADEDLRALLEDQQRGAPPAGALLFTCNGRGTRMFPGPNHDAALLREVLGPIPVAGFFAMGEIGPIGGQNFVHGFTASVALFEEV